MLSVTSTMSDAVTVSITGLPTVRIAFRSTPSPSAAIAATVSHVDRLFIGAATPA